MAAKPKRTPAKRKKQPPKGFTATKQVQFIAYVRMGDPWLVAIKKIGLEPAPIFAFIDERSDFREKVDAAEQKAVEQALFKAATEGKTVAAKIWLEFHGQNAGGAINDPIEAKKPGAPEPEQPERPFADLDSNVTPLRGRAREGK